MNAVNGQSHSLLIIKSQSSGLLAVENFLRNRGWNLTSTGDLQEAIAHILQKRPGFVMISVDHPNRKMPHLIRAISQSFPCCVIVFAEQISTRNYQVLGEGGHEYVIYPPLTGPAVERTVNKYYKDQVIKQLAHVDPEKILNSPLPLADDNFSVRGSKQNLENLLLEVSNEETPSLGKEISSPAFNFAVEQTFEGDETLIPTRLHRDTPVLRGSREALESSVLPPRDKISALQTLTESSHISCINVESHHYSGYLLMAQGKDKKVDETLLEAVHKKIFQFLNDAGERVADAKNMSLTLNSVPFEDWALEHAEFLRKTTHLSDEVALAYFPKEDAQSQLLQSSNDEMFSIEVSELKVDIPVDFNLYLYLPANQKYILYTPRGAVLYSKQMEKLTRQGITQMHFHSSEAQDFKTYRAQNFLNDKIDSFKEEMRIKAANLLSSQ